jgi:DNA modification methylase
MIDTIIQGDCIEVMAGMPDNYVDIVVTSPPYNQIGSARGSRKGWSSSAGMYKWKKWHERVREGRAYDDDMPEDEYQAWLKDVVTECLRVSKGLVWVNHKVRYRGGVGIHPLSFLPFPFHSELIWSRNGSMALNCKRFAPSHELIYGFGTKHYWEDSMNKLCSVWKIAAVPDDGHPCTWPIVIPKRLIAASCPPGGIVHDPFMGVGKTAIAAIKTDRHYIGTDTSEKYCQIARERIRIEQLQLKLNF